MHERGEPFFDCTQGFAEAATKSNTYTLCENFQKRSCFCSALQWVRRFKDNMYNPINIYLFRKTCEIYSKLPIKTPERHPCVYIVNCKYILHFFLVFIVNFEHTFVCWAIWVRRNRDKENSIFGRFYAFISGGQAQRVKGT